MINCTAVLSHRDPAESLDPATGRRRMLPGRVRCRKLLEGAGFNCSIPVDVCERCDARQPAGAAGPVVAVAESAVLRPLLKGILHARLLAGDAPRYQTPNPVDLNEAFARFTALAEGGEPADLLKAMFRYQARLQEKDGGHPPAALAQRLDALAARFNLTPALEEVIHEHVAARRSAG